MKKRKIEVPLQNGKELKPIMIKPNMGRIIKPMAKFPDLSGDGKVTKKDILMGKGVIDKPKNKLKKDTPERLKIKKTGRELQNALIKEKSKPATQQDKRVINQLQGAIEEQKKKLKNPTMKKPKMYKKPKAMATITKKKNKTSIDRSSYKKKKLTRSEKLANKASRISKKKTAVVAAKGRSSEKAARIIKKENRIYNREAKVNAKKAGAPTRKTRTVTKTGNKKVVNVADKTGSIIKTKEKRISRPTMKKPKMYNKPKYYGKKKK